MAGRPPPRSNRLIKGCAKRRIRDSEDWERAPTSKPTSIYSPIIRPWFVLASQVNSIGPANCTGTNQLAPPSVDSSDGVNRDSILVYECGRCSILLLRSPLLAHAYALQLARIPGIGSIEQLDDMAHAHCAAAPPQPARKLQMTARVGGY